MFACRPDGLTLVPWERSKSLVWDFTCAVHLCFFCTCCRECRRRQGCKYEFLAQHLHFVPVVVETSGVLESGGLRFLREVVVRMVAVTGKKRTLAFLLDRMSSAKQRGSSARDAAEW